MTDDERLEADLRRAYARRDPGPPPTTLRAEVAAVPSAVSNEPWPGARLIGLARPVITLIATTAAVIAGFVAVSALRTTGAGPGGPRGPGPVPSSGVVAPGAVLAPPTVDGATVSAFLGVLVVVLWIIVEALAATDPSSGPVVPWRFGPGLGWLGRQGLRRFGFGLAFLSVVSYPWVASSVARLGQGSVGASSSVDLLGARSGFAAQKDVLFYAGRPGATISVGFSIRNGGWVPLTVLGLDPVEIDAITPSELRRFAVEDPNALQSPDEAATVPFTPFELKPDEQRYLVFVEHIATCPGATAPPPEGSPPPSASPDMNNYAPPGGATRTMEAVPIRFSALGLGHTTWVEFAWSIVLVNPPSC